MNTLRRTKRATTLTPRHRPVRRLAATMAPVVLLAGLLLPAPAANAVASLPEDTPIAAAASATDSTGNTIPPALNSHVDPWCVSPGTSGARVEMLLIEEPGDLDATTRAQFIAELREEARYIDDAFAVASAETGGTNMGKRIRWSHEGSTCTPMVRTLTVPANSLGQNSSTAMTAVQQAYPGLLTTNRIYLGFTAKSAMQPNMPSCGQTTTMAGNRLHNDGRTIQFARVNHTDSYGNTCHSVNPTTYDSTTLHELLHVLGATYSGAPGNDGGSHCNDGYEALCEAQNDLNPKCEGRWVIDCGKDTYFNTQPTPGTYLADPANWNVANSPFLANVAQLPPPPAASMTFNTNSPAGNDAVTATVTTTPGATVHWAADQCAYTGAPTSTVANSNGLATYTIQCYGQAIATVAARVWVNGQIVVARPKASVTYSAGPHAEATISGPTSAAPGQQVTLTASTDAPGNWAYEWFAGDTGCGVPVYGPAGTGVAGKSITFTCNGTLSSMTFFAEATRIEDSRPASSMHRLNVTTTGVPTGDLDVRVAGNPMAAGGATSTVAATMQTSGATIAGWSWSATAGCSATPDAGDRSIAYVVCPTATNTQVTITATATASDGRVGTGIHSMTVVPGTPPPPPPPVPPTPPTPPVSAKATTTDVSADPSGNNTTYTVTVRSKSGTPLAGQRAAIEVRSRAGGTYSVLTWVTTTGNGTATVTVPAKDASFARAQFPGDSTWSPSVSREVSVTAAIIVKASKWGTKGLTAQVKTTGGSPATKVVLALEKKVGNKWKKVTSTTTNSKGVAQVKMKVRSKTVYRFNANASSAYRTDLSPNVTLKPKP